MPQPTQMVKTTESSAHRRKREMLFPVSPSDWPPKKLCAAQREISSYIELLSVLIEFSLSSRSPIEKLCVKSFGTLDGIMMERIRRGKENKGIFLGSQSTFTYLNARCLLEERKLACIQSFELIFHFGSPEGTFSVSCFCGKKREKILLAKHFLSNYAERE